MSAHHRKIERMFEDLRVGRTEVVAELRRRIDALDRRPGAVRGSAFRGRRDAPHDQSGILAAPGALATALPGGGLPRGAVVSLGATSLGGTSSLLLALLAAPRDIWCAVVGLPDLGLAAAAEMGVDLRRLGIIPDPGQDLPQVISVLADGVDVIATTSPADLPAGLTPGRRRVITGRLRDSGTVLLVIGSWPGADLMLTVTDMRWSGVGHGHGLLRDRELDIRVGGRRARSGTLVTLALNAEWDGVIATQAAREPGNPTQSARERHESAVAAARAG